MPRLELSYKGREVAILDPDCDANRATALTIIDIEGQANRARFARHGLPPDEVDQVFATSPERDVPETIENLRHPDWTWVIASVGGRALSFALLEPNVAEQNIHVLELHTRPTTPEGAVTQRRGLASVALAYGLTTVMREYDLGARPTVSLHVAHVLSPHTPANNAQPQHPQTYYHSLGFIFSPSGSGAVSELGHDVRIYSRFLHAPASVVHDKLRARLRALPRL